MVQLSGLNHVKEFFVVGTLSHNGCFGTWVTLLNMFSAEKIEATRQEMIVMARNGETQQTMWTEENDFFPMERDIPCRDTPKTFLFIHFIQCRSK